MKRYLVHFTGRVQGVGFRATTRSIARDYAVAGEVRNLPDGRVALVAEGTDEQLAAFLRAILDRMARHIVHHTLDIGPATGQFGQPQPGAVEIAY